MNPICTKHNEEKVQITASSYPVGYRFRCRSCIRSYRNPEKQKRYSKKWRESNPGSYRNRHKNKNRLIYQKKWVSENRKRVSALSASSAQKQRDVLASSYIKKLLCCHSSLSSTDIDNQYIELKREQILFLREINKIKVALNGNIRNRAQRTEVLASSVQ